MIVCTGAPTLMLVECEGGDMAHQVRPSTWATRIIGSGTDAIPLSALFDQYLEDCAPSPEHSMVKDTLTGEAASELDRFAVWVPSRSKPGTAYRVRVLFHKARPDAPVGYVTAVHELHGCEAHNAGKRCWHLDIAVAAVARDFSEFLPYGGRVGELVSTKAVRSAAEPAPSVPPTATAGFYD